mgnify:CR=1 FL=1
MTLPELPLIESSPPLVPAGPFGLAGKMQTLLQALKPRTDAEALRLLRANFPHSSLTERMNALSSRQGKPPR